MWCTLLFTLLIIMIPTTAQAYIDPGSGAFVVQMLLAAIATVVVTVKLWWSRFLALFTKEKTPESSQEEEGEGGEPHDK